jgi:predicted dehydrogenase
MSKTLIGIIGCGNISDAYFKGAARSAFVQVKACADLNAAAAQAKATLYGATALSVPALLADPDISLVVNLTVPLAHAAVSQQIVDAGKHVYSEKPLAANFADAAALMAQARVWAAHPIPSWALRTRPAAARSMPAPSASPSAARRW